VTFLYLLAYCALRARPHTDKCNYLIQLRIYLCIYWNINSLFEWIFSVSALSKRSLNHIQHYTCCNIARLIRVNYILPPNSLVLPQNISGCMKLKSNTVDGKDSNFSEIIFTLLQHAIIFTTWQVFLVLLPPHFI
jgi:hypothetical protein